jgi:PAS domain S-box-containing protein
MGSMTETNILRSLEIVSQAMNRARDVEHIIDDVLDAVFGIFRCDRIWLFHPCDPNTATIRVLAEKNNPEYPGAFASGEELPINAQESETIRKALVAGSPVMFGSESDNKIDDVSERFSVLSQMMMAIHPKTGKPWMFGMHQCTYPRVWTEDEQLLFKEISFRVVEGLNNLILLKDLKESEAKYRRFFTTVKNGWAHHKTVANAEGLPVDYIFMEVNQAFEELIGLKSEDIVGRPATQVLSHDKKTLAEWIEKFGRVALTGESVTSEGHFAQTDKWYSVSVSSPEPGHFITVFEDITERKEAFERFRTILDSLNSMVYVADMDTYELLYVNKYGREQWGDITGRICWQSLQAGQAGPCEFCTNDRLLAKDGTPMDPYVWEFRNTIDNEWYECRDQAIRWLDGRMVRMEIASNITQRKLAEEQKAELEEKLRQALKMEAIGTLAGGIAHDFNNILGAILGYAELAKESSRSFPEIYGKLDKVLQAGHRAKELVKQILTFSRQAVTERIALHPASLVTEAVKMLRSTLPATIDILLSIDPQAGPVLADPTQIHQILMNLCTNAFHAMEDSGGRLEIMLKETASGASDPVKVPGSEAGKYVQLSICDTGTGIDPGIRDKIFDPYFTTKEAGKGTGMGLAVTHGIVKSYGGAISIDSEPGKGTTVHVFLPIVDNGTVFENDGAEPIPGGSERILFIDDEKILTSLNKVMLEELGYKVAASCNSLEALQIFRNHPDQFDLVITDQTMPAMTGAELAAQMLQIRPDLPIILCTGYSSIISREEARSMGIKSFAAKPLGKRELAILVRKSLNEGP